MKYINFIILFSLLSCSQLTSARKDKLSILQGITSSKEVEFSIVDKKGRDLRFELRSEDAEIIEPDQTKTIEKSYSDFVIHKVLFSRDSSKEYNLYVYQNNKVIDQRLIGRGQKDPSKLRLVVASCLNDYYPHAFKIWDIVAQKNPEYLLLIGDNVYTDAASLTTTQTTNPEIIWQRYLDLRFKLPLYYQQKLIPVHALWDDHDFGVNNGNKSFSYKEESKEIFETFWAQSLAEDNWTKGLGVGGLLSLGDFNLYFLDARSFRAENNDGPHLGLDQSAWFYSKLREEATPSLLIKGDQFFGGYHRFESFEGSHPADFASFVTELSKVNTPFVFVSGDRHMSEIMHFPRNIFGKPSFEITSSPIHGKVYPNEDSNPWRVVAEKDHINFTLIDNLAKDDHWFMDVENIGENGEIYFRRELAVFIKDLQNNLNEVRKRRGVKRRYQKVSPKKRR